MFSNIFLLCLVIDNQEAEKRSTGTRSLRSSVSLDEGFVHSHAQSSCASKGVTGKHVRKNRYRQK